MKERIPTLSSLYYLDPKSNKDIIRNYKAISVMNSVTHAFEKIIKKVSGKMEIFLSRPKSSSEF